MHRPGAFFPISFLALCLAFAVVVLGAYTRLTDAGLGCPDWPGCYGRMTVPSEQEVPAHLQEQRPLEPHKARTEMVHRYAAGTLGILIFLLAVLGWQYRRVTGQPYRLPLLLAVLVIFQALLGMWTVTWLLKPIVVTAHLLGGMTIVALLFWLVLVQFFHGPAVFGVRERLLPWVVVALFVLAVQIFLGGWTSANYAAIVCPEFPTCRDGTWWPDADFAEAFTFWRGIGTSFEGGVLDAAGRTAIQLAHRVGALVVAVVIGAAAVRALFSVDRRARLLGGIVLFLLCTQIGLGVANVVLLLPLPVAVAHNATATLLLLSLVALLHHAVITRH